MSKFKAMKRLVAYIFYFILQCDISFAASYESKVTPLIIAIFIKFSSGTFSFHILQVIYDEIETYCHEFTHFLGKIISIEISCTKCLLRSPFF